MFRIPPVDQEARNFAALYSIIDTALRIAPVEHIIWPTHCFMGVLYSINESILIPRIPPADELFKATTTVHKTYVRAPLGGFVSDELHLIFREGYGYPRESFPPPSITDHVH